jgi:hypothetical protein
MLILLSFVFIFSMSRVAFCESDSAITNVITKVSDVGDSAVVLGPMVETITKAILKVALSLGADTVICKKSTASVSLFVEDFIDSKAVPFFDFLVMSPDQVLAVAGGLITTPL